MSYAIRRFPRPMWRWSSHRSTPRFVIRRDHILGLHGSGAYYTRPRSSEIVSFLKRYGRSGVAEWVNRSMSESSEQLSLTITTGAKEPPTPWNIANAITVGRIAVTPLVGNWIISGQYNLALAGLAYAAVSDALDGFLARRLNLRTVVGSYLDPAADKLLISTISACLAFKGVIPVGLVALMIGRDLGLIGGWLWYSYAENLTNEPSRAFRITHLEPLFISKLNTSLQIGLGFTGVLYAADWGVVNEGMVQSIAYATALTTTASGISYANKFWKTHSG